MGLVWIFLWLLPFQFALNPTPDIDLAVGRALALLLIGVALFSALLRKHVIVSVSPLSLGLFLFFVWSALSLVWAQEISLGLRKLLFLFNSGALFWAIPLLVARKKKLITALVYPAGVVSLVAIVQFIGQFIIGLEPTIEFWRHVAPFLFGQAFAGQLILHSSWLVEVGGITLFRAIALFPDPHILGFYLAFLTPLAWSMQYKNARIVALLCSIAVLFTFSRAAYIGGAAALLAFFGLIVTQKYRVKAKNVTFFVVALSVGLCALSLLFTPIGQRFISAFNPLEGSNSERLANWQQALTLIQEHPVQGVGLGNYATMIEPLAESRLPLYAHNLYLDIAAELGLIGLLLFLWVAWAALYKAYYTMPALFLGLLWFFVQSLFDTPLFSVHILPLFIISLTFLDEHTA